MHVSKLVAVLDVGKTNAKVVIVNAAGVEVAKRSIRNSVCNQPPYPHYDVDALWLFALDALAHFAKDPGFDAISITTHGACAVLLDSDGGLALPVLDYEHHYPTEIIEEYAILRPPFKETFSPALSGGLNLGAQLHYLKALFPSKFSEVSKIVTYPQFWAFRLTGVASSEITSLGCHTDLWKPQENEYSSLVDTLGIRGILAPVRSAFEQIGAVEPGLAAALGLDKTVPVFCGIHDSNSTLLPHVVGQTSPFSVVSTGTWVVCFSPGGDVTHLDPDRDTLANVDAVGRPVPSSRFMGGREFEILTSELGELDESLVIDALPSVVENKTMLLPSLVEGCGPYPASRRQWLNAADKSRHERWAAACLYLALMTETCLELVAAQGPLLIEGPFSRNDAYLLAVASLMTEHVVIALPGSTGTSQGAALLAGMKPSNRNSKNIAPLRLEELDAYRAAWRQAASGGHQFKVKFR
ncbi:FGGY-family carbohydrate kinase [Agrobacterium pusense]|uniref:FGGY-family carbohydrate kinase n=1 Tax=Agrobacterium pusense TaxID=648995 RepID=UPI0035A5B11F